VYALAWRDRVPSRRPIGMLVGGFYLAEWCQ
ncbi:hypothetical protein A2U01_0066602, partial [Trifolium medium]|nr:hypothetical protein [Trifolium medium]